MRERNRRQFLGSTITGTALASMSFSNSEALARLLSERKSPDNSLSSEMIRFPGEIEAIVSLIESTPRNKCFDVIADRISKGMTYRSLMSALFLAGIRNVDSSHVGGNLHTVFVVHSAHQLGLDSAVDQRLLPMFWALDYFKRVQESGRQTRILTPPAPSRLLEDPIDELERGCIAFDADRIERALISLVRTRGAAEVAEPLWRLAARDFVPLGHKAIYMANAWRTLQTIGWNYAEPTLRSLAHSLASYHGEGLFPMDKQCYNENWRLTQANSKSLPSDWAGSKSDPVFVKELVSVLRTGKHVDAAKLVVKELGNGSIQSASVWDAVHLAAGEIVLRQSTIGSMHGVTAANAVHYGFTQAAKRETRLLLLLQGVGFVCHFIPFLEHRETTRKTPFPQRNLLDLEAANSETDPSITIDRIFETVNIDPTKAASLALGFGQKSKDYSDLMRTARRFVYAKGNEAHRYKFAAAISEDIELVTPNWRPHILAAATQYFCGATQPDSSVMKRARKAIDRIS